MKLPCPICSQLVDIDDKKENVPFPCPHCESMIYVMEDWFWDIDDPNEDEYAFLVLKQWEG